MISNPPPNPRNTPPIAASHLSAPEVHPDSGARLLAAATLLATMVRATCPQEVRDDNAVWAALRVVEDAAVRARVDAHVGRRADGPRPVRRPPVVTDFPDGSQGAEFTVASTEGEIAR